MPQVKFYIVIGGREDLELLVRHRLKMFEEINTNQDGYLPDFNRVTEQWISRKLEDNNFIAFIARTTDGIAIGSGCLLIKEDQPRPTSLRTSAPYLLSMFTEPEYRGSGVASAIVEESIKWARKNGYDRIDLHASSYGRAIYGGFGFKPTNEMRLVLSEADL